MFKFVSKALAGLVLTKDAQTAIGQRKATPAAKNAKQAAPVSRAQSAPQSAAERRAEEIAKLFAENKDLINENRAALLANAMKVRAAKQTVLTELGDADRAKLVAFAMKRLLNEGPESK